MSSKQTQLDNDPEIRYYRSIVKDGNVTREDNRESRAEIAVWMVKSDEKDQPEEIKTKVNGRVQYKPILEVALGRRQVDKVSPTTAEELSRRTGLSSYADSRGGRSASTIRGYLSGDTLSRLPSSHPVKRILRRYVRSQEFGHFAERDADPDDVRPIDKDRMLNVFTRAKMICIGQPLYINIVATTSGVSVEDNERIDKDEIRPNDRPLGEVQASLLLESGSYTQEYRIDLDDRTVTPEDGLAPPGGY
jgi:hypothetical protein